MGFKIKCTVENMNEFFNEGDIYYVTDDGYIIDRDDDKRGGWFNNVEQINEYGSYGEFEYVCEIEDIPKTTLDSTGLKIFDGNNNCVVEYKSNDNVNHPSHYVNHPSGIECYEIAKYYDFPIGNAIKYLWRAGLKQDVDKSLLEKEIEDLKKAKWYIESKIKDLEKKLQK
jgi:hypothetical protein